MKTKSPRSSHVSKAAAGTDESSGRQGSKKSTKSSQKLEIQQLQESKAKQKQKDRLEAMGFGQLSDEIL